jgi:uncharacterized protein (TIGR02646 family)
MRQITKSAEPATLTQHRLQTHANYDNYPDKDGLRRSLCAEQLSICCYCAGRIFSQPDKMKIEHFSSQEHHEGLQLTYSNLLGACLGGQGNAPRDQHCDTHKGSSALSRSPASPTNIESFLNYSGDGTITSPDEVFDKELNEVLNLNHPTLKQNRKSTLTSFLDGVGKAHNGTLTRDQWQNYLSKYQGSSGTIDLIPYAPVIAHYIRKKLKANP